MRAVIAESYERIHRSNLVGMGILPLQFEAGQNTASIGLTGEEIYDIDDPFDGETKVKRHVVVKARAADGTTKKLRATVRIDTPQEVLYDKHGGILPYVLRQLLA